MQFPSCMSRLWPGGRTSPDAVGGPGPLGGRAGSGGSGSPSRPLCGLSPLGWGAAWFHCIRNGENASAKGMETSRWVGSPAHWWQWGWGAVGPPVEEEKGLYGTQIFQCCDAPQCGELRPAHSTQLLGGLVWAAVPCYWPPRTCLERPTPSFPATYRNERKGHSQRSQSPQLTPEK